MEKIKISVIVPVYNVEKYLSQCLDSIIHQTYKNLEIILVDDGSTDSSGLICDNYSQKDKRIKIIHKCQGGLSDARNAGLKIATGEYISFIDSDDFIDKNMYSILINNTQKYNSDIVWFNYYNYYSGSFYPKDGNPAGQLLVKQVEHYVDYDKRLDIAIKFIQAAADNIYRNLRYYNGREKDISEYMRDIDSLRGTLCKARTIEELMGIEGNIRKRYYAAWNVIVNQDIQFDKRVMHPPDNMINSLISFVNSLVYTRLLSEIYHTQLNPTISYLHEPGVRRYSLCLDISEVFKPLIGDRLIFSLLNRRQITEDSFTKELNYLHLKKEASKLIVSEFENRMKKTIMHKELGRQVSYQYLMRLEAYKLIKHLIGEKEYEGFRIWW